MKKLEPKKVCAKFSKICRIWDNGGGVFVVKLFGECSSFEALSKEYAIIKAIGLNRLTNVINGTCYGDMKACWNETEVVNYGNMLLMNVFNMCIQETPVLVIMMYLLRKKIQLKPEDVNGKLKECLNVF